MAGELEEKSSPHMMMPRLVGSLSSLLQRVVESNDMVAAAAAAEVRHHQQGGGGFQLGQQKQKQRNMMTTSTVFHGLTKPTISVRSYLERIFTYANCSPSCYVVAYVYLDRFSQRQPLIAINSLNVHRLLITSVLVAAKFMDDVCYNNAYFAKVGGICTLEMNFLERDFLFGLNFRLNVTPSTFESYCTHLQREMYCLECPAASQLRFQFCFLSSEDESGNNQHQQQQKLQQQQQQQQQLAV